MDVFRLDRLLDVVTGTQVLVGSLWLGLAAITITLLVLMQTRWGQSRPLRKCVVLSLLAHLLLVGYATTVEIVASVPTRNHEPVVNVSIADEAFAPNRQEDLKNSADKPWESYGSPSPSLDPVETELARADSVEMSDLERMTTPDFQTLTDEPTTDNLELEEAVQPEPADLPHEAAAEKPSLAVKATAEPIEAPAAQRSEGPVPQTPSGPRVDRRSETTLPSIERSRMSPQGAASSLVEQPRPIPTIKDAPASEEPQDSLAGQSDNLPTPSHGKPAEELPGQQLPATLAPSTVAIPAEAGPVGAPSDHLRPPSMAGQDSLDASDDQLVSIPQESLRVGPPLLPTPRRQTIAHEVPNAYRLRVAPDRNQVARQLGATPETEEAVAAALKWLAVNQEPDGRWSCQAHGGGRELNVAGRDRQAAGTKADTGMTGLALLAFLAAGHSHKAGDYPLTVQRGVQYLVSQQDRDGGLGGEATTYAYMYCHAMATFALSEAYGMTGDPNLRDPVRRAVARTLNAQSPSSGGWRYFPGDPGDTSQLGWQLMALKSADLAGIPMPETAKLGAKRFLDSVSSGEYGGLASYRPGERVSRPMTAEALACRQFLGLYPEHSVAREAGDYLLAELPGEGAKNFYYWYYGTLSMFQLQGPHWHRWNRALQDTLVRSQQKSGPSAGSWDPDTVWGGYGGRVYTTALGTLCLEVYYRFLPLYVEVATGAVPRR